MRAPGISFGPVVVLAMLVAAIATAYAPILRHDLVSFSEGPVLVDDPAMQAPLDLQWMMEAATQAQTGVWAPLARLAQRLDVALFGFGRPQAVLAMNVALFAVASAFLFLLMHRWTASLVASALTAALFGLHPLQVELVCRADARGDLLALALLTFTAWIHAGRPRSNGLDRMSTRREAGLLVCTVLAVMASPLGILLPFALVWVDARSEARPRWVRAGLLEMAPLFAIAACAVLLNLVIARDRASSVFAGAVDLPLRIQVRLQAWSTLARDTLAPVDITSLRSHPLSAPDWVPSIVVLLIVAVLLTLILRAGGRWWAAGWLLAFLPVLLSSGPWLYEVRWTLAPTLVLMIGIGLVLAKRERSRGRALAVLAIVAVIVSSPRARDQVHVWRDEVRVLEHAVAVDPSSWLAHDRLARLHHERGENERALHHGLATLGLAPGYTAAQAECAVLLHEAEDHFRAELLAQNAIATGWDDREADVRLGLALVRAGLDSTAIGLLERARRRNPKSGDIHAGLALVHARRGEPERAALHRAQAESAVPVTPAGNILFAWLLASAPEPALADPTSAIARVRRTLDPESPEIELLEALSVALARTGAWSEAFEVAMRAARAAAARGWAGRETVLRARALDALRHRAWTEPRPRQNLRETSVDAAAPTPSSAPPP